MDEHYYLCSGSRTDKEAFSHFPRHVSTVRVL